MIAESFNFFLFSGIALTLALLMARIASQKDGVKRYHLLTLKKCPNCAEQLPLSALVCDECDYNFLSGTVEYPHKLLSAPSQ
jgi:predicted amidophosphoribosyltransferase